MGPGSHAWFDFSIEPNGERTINEAQETQSRALVAQTIQAASEQLGIPPERVVVGGFSQGGIMALSLLLTQPALMHAALVWHSRLLQQVVPLDGACGCTARQATVAEPRHLRQRDPAGPRPGHRAPHGYAACVGGVPRVSQRTRDPAIRTGGHGGVAGVPFDHADGVLALGRAGRGLHRVTGASPNWFPIQQAPLRQGQGTPGTTATRTRVVPVLT